MATSFVQLGNSDSLETVVRKCNENFRVLSADLSKNIDTVVRRENESNNDAIRQLSESINNSLNQLSSSISSLNTKLEESVKPAIGSIIISENLPSIQGTTWELYCTLPGGSPNGDPVEIRCYKRTS